MGMGGEGGITLDAIMAGNSKGKGKKKGKKGKKGKGKGKAAAADPSTVGGGLFGAPDSSKGAGAGPLRIGDTPVKAPEVELKGPSLSLAVGGVTATATASTEPAGEEAAEAAAAPAPASSEAKGDGEAAPEAAAEAQVPPAASGAGGTTAEEEAAAKAAEAKEEEEDEASGSAESPSAGAASMLAAARTQRAAYKAGEDGTDPREHFNVVFMGHVDAGKSTLSGNILFLTGMVDDRVIDKFKREAKSKNRESWFLAFIMDTSEEEREKGKTVEVGRAHFDTENKRFTILDAPGHKAFVPNMIQGASAADLGVLVISARKGEFETGFERGGQTREHTLLAKTLGVSKLIVAVNKMDEPSVQWAESRWQEIQDKLTPFLKKSGYKSKHVQYVPISGLNGANVKDPVGKEVCPWYEGPTLLQVLDDMKLPHRDATKPVRVPVLDRIIDRGVVALGKVEQGVIEVGQTLAIMPTRKLAKIEAITLDDETEVPRARPGENVLVRLKGVTDADVQRGFVLCEPEAPCPAVRTFQAQLQVSDLGERSLLTAGYQSILHVHTSAEECVLEKIVSVVNSKTGKEEKAKFIRSHVVCTVVISVSQSICVEKFADTPQLGRFTLRDEGVTMGVGKIVGLPRKQVEASTEPVTK